MFSVYSIVLLHLFDRTTSLLILYAVHYCNSGVLSAKYRILYKEHNLYSNCRKRASPRGGLSNSANEARKDPYHCKF